MVAERETMAGGDGESASAESGRRPYEPPAIRWLGTLDDLTDATGGISYDGYFFSSDRNLKEDVAPVDPRAVLYGATALPVEPWRYRGSHAPRLGPMAQHFAAAFGL